MTMSWATGTDMDDMNTLRGAASRQPASRTLSRGTALRSRTAVPLAALATAVFAVWMSSGFGVEPTTRYVNDVGTIVAALAASLLCFRAALGNTGGMRRFRWLLGAACTAWTLGEVIWAAYDLPLSDPIPVPSWADLGYLGAIPLAVAALLAHPAMVGTAARRARFTLEGLLVATALLFLGWTLVLGPLWRSTDVTTLGGLVAIAYPFGDVVIVFFVVLGVRRMGSADRLALWCLLDTGWFAGCLVIAVGAFGSHSGGVTVGCDEATTPAVAALVVPFVPIVGALSVIALKPELVQALDPVAFTLAFALAALVLARQLLVLREALTPSGHSAGGLAS